ncbi:hypothetical protein L6V77_32310 [Myxococcota bacterium]|nr:hypothetical protein [Myxococcota bacterium]
MPAEQPFSEILAQRRITGADGFVTGLHVWGAERRIRVGDGEVAFTLYPGGDLLEVRLTASGPVRGVVARGRGGYGLTMCFEVKASALLDERRHLRPGASVREARCETEGCYRDGTLLFRSRERLSVPSFLCPEIDVERALELAIDVSPDLDRIGRVYSRVTSRPRFLALPLHIAAFRFPFPTESVLTDAVFSLA